MLAAGLALLATTVAAPAIVPATMNFQGRLTDNTPGQNAIDQVLPMIFRIYDAASGGTMLWSEIWPAVNVSGGLFSVQLGSSGSPLTEAVFLSPDRFIEIEVDTEVLSPRQALSSVAFAQQADNSGSLGGSPAADWQKRVSSACGPGIHMRGISIDGTPICEAVPPGDITMVTAGIGLVGGASDGDATLDVEFDGSGFADTVARSDHTHGGPEIPVASAQRVRLPGLPVGGGMIFGWIPGEQTLSENDATEVLDYLPSGQRVRFEDPVPMVRPQDNPGDGVITIVTSIDASALFFVWQELAIQSGLFDTLEVELLDESNLPVKRLRLTGAWPRQWTLGYLPSGEAIVTVQIAATTIDEFE